MLAQKGSPEVKNREVITCLYEGLLYNQLLIVILSDGNKRTLYSGTPGIEGGRREERENDLRIMASQMY